MVFSKLCSHHLVSPSPFFTFLQFVILRFWVWSKYGLVQKRGWVYLKELTKLIWKGSEGIVWGMVWEDLYKDIKLWWIYFQLSWFQILNSTNSQFHKPVPHKAQKKNILWTIIVLKCNMIIINLRSMKYDSSRSWKHQKIGSKAGNGSLLYKIQKLYANVVGLIRAFIGPFMVSQLTEVIFNLNWFRFFFRHLQKPKSLKIKKNFS